MRGIKDFTRILVFWNVINFINSQGVSSVVTLTESDVIQLCQGFEFQFVAHPSNKQNYVICVPGGGVEKACPANECFDERNSPCTTNCNTNTITADQATKEYCNSDETALLDRVANDKNCESYFICMGKNIDPLSQKCPANQHFSEEHKTCRSFHEANCAASSKWCKRKRNGTRFPHINCHRYYECQNETTIVEMCRYGERYSRDAGKCVSGICQGDQRTPNCTAANDGVRMVHNKCYKYYMCLNRSVFEAQCPTGYYFDKIQSVCIRDVNNICKDI